METNAPQLQGEVGGGRELRQEVVVQLEPVEAVERGEGGGGDLCYLAVGEVQALEILTTKGWRLDPVGPFLTLRLWKVSRSTRLIGFPFNESVIRYRQSFRASCTVNQSVP